LALNDDIADALTGHQIGLQRLSNATVRKILALLNRSDARIVARLLEDDISALSRARQDALLNDIRRIVASVYEDATGALQVDLERLGQYEAEYTAKLFGRLVPIEFNTIRPSAEQIIAATNSRPFQGRILRDWYKELERGSFERLRNVIRAGIVEGRTIDQLVREVRGTRAQGFKDGILQVNRRAAEATVRTAISHTANSARELIYAQNEDIIKGVQWSATLDGRTSAVCRARDGKVYPVNKGPRPPAHPNCRSSTVPVTKSWREMGIDMDEAPAGTRASMNGQVAANQTYDDWLRKQPVTFQDDVLGVRKAQLFRAGLKMDRYVDRAGVEYTLDELKRREADIWQRAFQS
jgi:SPP1 gp7 family putative phage head morphogenesis protein